MNTDRIIPHVVAMGEELFHRNSPFPANNGLYELNRCSVHPSTPECIQSNTL